MKTQTPHFKWKPTLVIGTRSWSITVASVAPRVRVMVQITSANGTTFFSVPLTKHTKSASELNSQGKESTRPGASPAGKLERWDQVKKWCFSIVNQFHPTLLITKYNAMMLWNQFHPIFFQPIMNYVLDDSWRQFHKRPNVETEQLGAFELHIVLGFVQNPKLLVHIYGDDQVGALNLSTAMQPRL